MKLAIFSIIPREDVKVEIVKMLKKKGGKGTVRSEREKRILLMGNSWMQVPLRIIQRVESSIRQEFKQGKSQRKEEREFLILMISRDERFFTGASGRVVFFLERGS
jgi:hypothetical protein